MPKRKRWSFLSRAGLQSLDVRQRGRSQCPLQELKPEPEPGVGSPGPIYTLPRGLGKQPDARLRTEPMMSIASAERTPIEPGSNSPGPIYSLPSAIDKQIDGHKHSAPRPSFSKHSRWAGLEAEQKKNTVPGPGHYG